MTSDIDQKKQAIRADAEHRRSLAGAARFIQVWNTMQPNSAASSPAYPRDHLKSLKRRLKQLPIIGRLAGLAATILRLPSRLGSYDAEFDRLRALVAALAPLTAKSLQQETKIAELLAENHGRVVRHNALLQEHERLQTRVQELSSQLLKLADRTAPVAFGPTGTNPPVNPVLDAALDTFYWQFEERFRGSEAAITQRLAVYQPYLDALRQRLPGGLVVDVGCGRGEWLRQVRHSGLTTKGMDMNERMIAHCRSQGLDVVYGDATILLQSEASNSLAAVTGFHIVEHLPFASLFRLFLEAYRALAPGGFVLFETPNPENPRVGSCDFYTDPTHKNPIPPATLGFMLECVGFRQQECLRLGAQPLTSRPEDPNVAAIVESFHQGGDYAIIGFKAALEL